MVIKVNKKQLTFISLMAFAILAIGFAIVTILSANSLSPTSNQIIPQNIKTSGTMDMTKVEECFSKSEDEQQKCLDDFMVSYFQGTGETTKQVLADLEAARSTSTTIENDCHPIVHAIGRLTYKLKGNIGDAFEACDQTCHSGCYHGVMERLFYSDTELSSDYKHLTYDDMKEKIPGICDKDKFKNPSNAVIFQCLHGVGHALMYTLDYDLDASLKSCDLLPTNYDRSSCYGGVIMENVTAFDKKKRDLKADDPLYPCSRLDNKYKADCYLMQTSVMSEYGLNNQQVVDECKKTGDYMPQCFVSMGRDLSNYVRTGNVSYVVTACEDTAKENVRPCMDGAIYALIDNTWDLSFAYKLCDSLNIQKNIEDCFSDANNYYKSTYVGTAESMKGACTSYVNGKRSTCLSIASSQ
ncbi:MAG: hypothetical protein ABI721_03215 [Candidatus Dojkabacteria bacterium]